MLTSRFGAIPSRGPLPSRSPGLRRRPSRRATDDHLRRPGGLGHPRIIAPTARPRTWRRRGRRPRAIARRRGWRRRARRRPGPSRARRLATARGPLRDGAGRAPDRALLLAVEAIHRGDTLQARGSLLDALLTPPSVTAFYHRARGLVLSVAFSPDGKTLAAGCSDGRQGGLVLLCDPSRSTETPLPAPEGGVRAVAFSPDGKTLAAGAGRGVVLWDVERRARLGERPLDFPGNSVSSVAFSPDGQTLAAGGWSRVVLWDVARRVLLGELPRLMDYEYPVSSLAFGPDGRTLVTVSGGALALWDAASRKPISEPFGDLDQAIECAAFSPDGKTLAAGLEAVDVDVCAGVALWDMEGRHRLFEQPLAVAGDRVTSVVFGNRMLAAGVDDRVVLWDLTRRPPLADRPQVIAGASITGLALSPDGKRLAAGYRRRDGGAVIWDLEARSPLEERPLLINADVFDVAFSPDGSTIAAAYDRGSSGGVALWDARRRARLADQPLEIAEGSPISVAYSPDGMALAAGFMRTDLKGGVILWDARRHTRLTDRPMAVAGGGNVFGVAFSPDGSTIAGDFRRHPLISGVVLWDARRGVQLAERTLADGKSLSRVVFSPDGQTLAGGYGYYKAEDGTDGGVALWDARGLAPVMEKALTIADRSVTSVAFSPDGSIIAATCRRWPGSQDGADALGCPERPPHGGKAPGRRRGLRGRTGLQPRRPDPRRGILGRPRQRCRALGRPAAPATREEAPGGRRGRRHEPGLQPRRQDAGRGIPKHRLPRGGPDLPGRRGPLRHRPGVVEGASRPDRQPQPDAGGVERVPPRHALPGDLRPPAPTARRRVGPTIVACDRSEGCIGGQTVSKGLKGNRVTWHRNYGQSPGGLVGAFRGFQAFRLSDTHVIPCSP